ncbi:protein NRT1/ PTR FAMILY 5.6-like [Argentina anserina]|uniref:protein NRT1/ PTR FAMILY 5.6-like n=1 Tax=Argentina anserina TaxID=57926 RepID=UPI0021763BA4|nr:protein NRT1/ PTR FAMILY 5.6-like [Potentilla anserina]
MERQENEKKLEISGGETKREEANLVHDSSVDYKGRVPIRAATGVWKASLFIITIEFSERLSYFGIATNLITYLTQVLHQDVKTAAKNVNYWVGVTTLVPIIGGFLADAYTGRYNMVIFASLVYLMGLSLLTMSQYIPSLKPCNTEICQHPRKLHEVLLFVALYFISVGTGGHKPCLQSFGADQFDDDHLEERKNKMSFFNWWNFALCCGLFLGVTVIVYIQDSVSWGVAALVLTVTLAVTIVTFYMGRYCYRYRVAQGSPLKPMLQVLVAAIRKRNLPNPENPDLLFEVPRSEKSSQGRLLLHTKRLRFLDKAAILEENEYPSGGQKHSPWRLATLTRVEELKLILNMIPIWFTSLPNTVCLAQAPTFFVKQAATMNRNVTNNFKIPPASIYSLGAISMLISVTVYDKIVVPILRKATGNERGMNILHRIGLGMLLAVVAMFVAALVEQKRLDYADPKAMSVFWLAPQYIILGIGDAFSLVGLQEYFYDQVPDSMRSLGVALYLSVIGVGSFMSSSLITILDHVTKKDGRSWFGKDLSSSRLDNFFWLLAALNVLNICVYGYLAWGYTYKNVERRVVPGDSSVTNGNDQSMA